MEIAAVYIPSILTTKPNGIGHVVVALEVRQRLLPTVKLSICVRLVQRSGSWTKHTICVQIDLSIILGPISLK